MTITAQAPPEQPDVAIRTRPPSPRRLSRKVLLAGALAASAVIVFALLAGLSPQRQRTAAEQEATPSASGPPESITSAAAQYEATSLASGQSEDALSNGLQDELAPPQDPLWTNAQSHPLATQAAGVSPPTPGAPQTDPQALARSSPILFAGASIGAPAGASDDAEARLRSSLTPPSSRYDIQAGSVIPAALVTGLNSDLPGRVIAQVTAPVYDSVTGQHLLIPQGARLLGSYDNGVRYGDHRILLVWNRLILPNGWSINLQDMTASDPTGAAGLSDRTDNHLAGLASAVGLSAIISVIANESEDDQSTDGSLAQSVGDAAAQQAAQTGSQIVQRQLTVRPTLRVRPGANVRVLVTRDIRLRPYRQGTP